MVMADLMRALPVTAPVDWMAVSSYGSGTKSSGVVRILKDLDTDITGRHVLIVEDIVDSGLTLSWIKSNLESRSPASVEICTLLRKPDAAKVDVDVTWVGFDIPNEFVVGYGLDYAEAYRGLRVRRHARPARLQLRPARRRPHDPRRRPTRGSAAEHERRRGSLLACTRPDRRARAGRPTRSTSRRTGAPRSAPTWTSSASSRPHSSGSWPSSW